MRLISSGASLLLAAACAGCAEPAPDEATPSAPADAPKAEAVESPSAASGDSTSETSASEAPELASSRVRLAFAGDLGMSGLVTQYVIRSKLGYPVPDGVDAGYPFAGVRDRIQKADVAIGNLECALSPIGPPQTDSAQPAPHDVVPPILDAGFDVVSVANNHVLDHGQASFWSMLRTLERYELPTMGAGSYGPHQEPWITEVRGLRIAFLAYHSVLTERAVAEVEEADAAADFVVVYNHWGGHWEAKPNRHQRELGRALVAAGADLVVGAHSHVLQPEEWIGDKLIVYGLGNFVFTGMNMKEAYRVGGLLEVDVGPEGIIGRRLWRTRLDEVGAPRWLEDEASLSANTRETAHRL